MVIIISEIVRKCSTPRAQATVPPERVTRVSLLFEQEFRKSETVHTPSMTLS